MSLRLRFTLFFTLVSLLLLGTFSALVSWQAERQALTSAEDALTSFLHHESEHGDFPFHGEEDEPGSPHFKDVYVRILKDGAVVYDSFPRAFAEDPFPPNERRGDRLYHSIRVSRAEGSYEIQGFHDLSAILAYLRDLRRLLALGCFAALLLIVPLSYASTKVLLEPFRWLAARTSELDAESLSVRFPAPRHDDEFALLTRNFNALLDRLDRSFRQMRRFASSASHELRTPLAVIINQGEMALRRPRTLEECREALEKMLARAKTLRGIVNRFLVLADVERMEQENVQADVPLRDFVSEVGQALRATQAREEAVVIESAISDGMRFQGNPDLLSSVLTNLLENAYRHARTRVRVSARKERRTLRLEIEDDGPGIPEEQHHRVFEPFYTTEIARGAARKGHGLGLFIVQTCVRSARGDITLGRSPLGGLSVAVSLPG